MSTHFKKKCHEIEKWPYCDKNRVLKLIYVAVNVANTGKEQDRKSAGGERGLPDCAKL